MLQCVAVSCTVLQSVAMCCSVLTDDNIDDLFQKGSRDAEIEGVLQCVARCVAKVLQCIAVCCIVL